MPRHASRRRSRRRNRNRPDRQARALRTIRDSRSAAPAPSATLVIEEYELTPEPMPDPWHERLPADERRLLDDLGRRLIDGERGLVDPLEQFIDRHPDVPTAYNHLAVAYQREGHDEEVEPLVRLTYGRFPDYLFARINYANLRMREGHHEEVPAILGGALSLHRMYPERGGRFHITEFTAFATTVARYHLLTGNVEAARNIIEAAHQVAPDNPQVRHLHKRLNNPLADIFGTLLGRTRAAI